MHAVGLLTETLLLLGGTIARRALSPTVHDSDLLSAATLAFLVTADASKFRQNSVQARPRPSTTWYQVLYLESLLGMLLA